MKGVRCCHGLTSCNVLLAESLRQPVNNGYGIRILGDGRVLAIRMADFGSADFAMAYFVSDRVVTKITANAYHVP